MYACITSMYNKHVYHISTDSRVGIFCFYKATYSLCSTAQEFFHKYLRLLSYSVDIRASTCAGVSGSERE